MEKKQRIKVLLAESVQMVEIDVQNRLREMGFEVTAIVHSTYELFKAVSERSPDVVLTDIHLERAKVGIKVAETLQEKHDIPVIFLSGESNYEIIQEAVEMDVYGFVSKPFDQAHLFGSIHLAVNNFKKSQNKELTDLKQHRIQENHSKDFIFVRSNYQFIKINLDQILFVESLKDYIGIHTHDRKVTVNLSMKKILNELPENDFCRVHKSFIVRLDKINYLKFPSLFVDGREKEIPVGGLYKDVLFEKIRVI